MFIYLLCLILGQLTTSKIPKEHQVRTVVSVITNEARLFAAQRRFQTITLQECVNKLKEKLLFHQNVEQRKTTDGNGVKFSQLGQFYDKIRKATTTWRKNLFAY